MIRGLTPTIYVNDLDRAVAFYRDTLGLKLTMHAPGHWAALAAPDGTNIGLHPVSPSAPKPGTPGSTQLGFTVDQPINQVVAELTRRGVRFRDPIRADTKVRIAFFTDPDGNTHYLCESN